MKSAFLLLALSLVCTMINCQIVGGPAPLDPENLDEDALAALKSAEPKYTLVNLANASRKLVAGQLYAFSGRPLFFCLTLVHFQFMF